MEEINPKQDNSIVIYDGLHSEINIGDKLFTSDCCNHDFKIIRITKITKEYVHYINELSDENEEEKIESHYFKSSYMKLPLKYTNLSANEIMNELNTTKIQDLKDDTYVESEDHSIIDLNKELVLNAKQRAENAFRMNELIHSVLENKMREIKNYAHSMEEYIEKLNRIITTIELYLGIHEEVIQISQGEKADMMSPICLRQKKLYMDEEAAILCEEEYDGIDFSSEEEFDDWVRTNFKTLIPEEKGLVLLGISRRERLYSTNPFANAFLNQNNKQQYMLIRNGDNLYRIWISSYVTNRLYALEDEFVESKIDYFNKKSKNIDMEKYNKNLLAIQGIIERTEIFNPLPHFVSIFEKKTYEDGIIKEIRDDEPSLTGGPFPEWKNYKNEINDKIKLGSRIYFCCNFSHEYDGWRFPHHNWTNPEHGIYNVEKVLDQKNSYENELKEFICYHNQKDTVYYGWYGSDGYHDRKNRVSFKVYKKDNILNYDEITLDAIDYYLHTRIGREQYWEMIPIMKKIRKYKLQEMKEEENFIMLLENELGEDAEPFIKSVIEWWKYKVIMKRPLMREDAKALRMIRSRTKKSMKGEMLDDEEF